MNSNSSDNQTLNSAIKSGKGLMNGLGGFLNKATSEIEKNLNQSGKSNNTSSKNIDEMLRKPDKMKKLHLDFWSVINVMVITNFSQMSLQMILVVNVSVEEG